MADHRKEAYELTGKVEKFLEFGSSSAALLAPEKAPPWTKALILTRFLRFELGRPLRQKKAASQGEKT